RLPAKRCPSKRCPLNLLSIPAREKFPRRAPAFANPARPPPPRMAPPPPPPARAPPPPPPPRRASAESIANATTKIDAMAAAPICLNVSIKSLHGSGQAKRLGDFGRH